MREANCTLALIFTRMVINYDSIMSVHQEGWRRRGQTCFSGVSLRTCARTRVKQEISRSLLISFPWFLFTDVFTETDFFFSILSSIHRNHKLKKIVIPVFNMESNVRLSSRSTRSNLDGCALLHSYIKRIQCYDLYVPVSLFTVRKEYYFHIDLN